jgi:hypothetical protein
MPSLIREPYEQAALAFLGKPANTQLTSLVEADFALPEEWRKKLSPNGKVSRFIRHSGRIEARRILTGSKWSTDAWSHDSMTCLAGSLKLYGAERFLKVGKEACKAAWSFHTVCNESSLCHGWHRVALATKSSTDEGKCSDTRLCCVTCGVRHRDRRS